jgi:hypothetical protein
MEKILQLPVDFIRDNIKYRYDFNLLTVEQAELAREAGEYKANTIQNPPDSFTLLIKSRACDWLTLIMSYLLIEVKDDVPQPFNMANSEIKTQQFIKSLPVIEIQRLRDCVTHFFTNINMSKVSSVILQGVKTKSVQEILFPLIMAMMMNKGNTESDSIKSIDSMMSENVINGL